MTNGDRALIRQTPRRQARKRTSLLILLSGILIFTAAAGVLYLNFLRPVTLHIAVGPTGSDDLKLIQAVAQAFARERSHIRLSPIITEGTLESISSILTSKADLAVARGDLDMPADARSVAILRKNVVVLWTPSAQPVKAGKKAVASKIKSIENLAGHSIGIIGRTQANVTMLRVILSE